MNTLQTVVGVLGGLLVLAGLAGGLWVAARASANDAALTRLRAENQDLVRRLDWIEPRHHQLEQQNELLLQLHNPTAALDALGTESRSSHARIVAILEDQSRTLQQIAAQLPHGGHHDG